MKDWKNGEVESHGNSSGLVVLLHGFGQCLTRLDSMAKVVTYSLPDADLLRPDLPYSNMVCTIPAIDIVKSIISAIDKAWQRRLKSSEGVSYEYVRVIGHSFGAVLARRVVLVANGTVSGFQCESEIAELMERPRAWSNKIDRLILIAGMIRGWEVSSAMGKLQKLSWRIGNFIGEVFFNRKFTIFDVRRGAVFLIQTRLHWIKFRDDPEFNDARYIVVQLLGTIDDIVSPEDNIDYIADKDNQFFNYITVPRSGHSSIVDMEYNASALQNDGLEAKLERGRFFQVAIAGAQNEIDRIKDTSSALLNNNVNFTDGAAKDVVFVIHGIRDRGYWTKKIANAINSLAQENHRSFSFITETYGYFGMAPFVLSWVRYRKVEWLMDVYANACARYPDANFHYVGHSNGTYLAAKALADYPACSFDHIVFAGSVVRTDYDWGSLMPKEGTVNNEKKQEYKVQKVMNYVASADAVVALFPKGLQGIPIVDLGSAGHDGFEQHQSIANLYPVKFVKGGHSAGIVESQWNEIAKFVVEGKVPILNSDNAMKDLVEEQNKVVKFLGEISGLSWVALIFIFGWIAVAVGTLLFGNLTGVSANSAAVYAFSLSALIVGLKSFLTKF